MVGPVYPPSTQVGASGPQAPDNVNAKESSFDQFERGVRQTFGASERPVSTASGTQKPSANGPASSPLGASGVPSFGGSSGAASPAHGEYEVTTLAIGEEDGGSPGAQLHHQPIGDQHAVIGAEPSRGTMAPIYSPGDPGYSDYVARSVEPGIETTVQTLDTMQPIYSPGEVGYDAFVRSSTGPDVLNYTSIGVSSGSNPAMVSQPAPVVTSQTVVTLESLPSGGASFDPSQYQDVGSYDAYIGTVQTTPTDASYAPQALPETAAVEYSVIEPSVIEPSATETIAAEPIAAEASTFESIVAEPIAAEPSTVEPIAIEPSAIEPSAAEPTFIETAPPTGAELSNESYLGDPVQSLPGGEFAGAQYESSGALDLGLAPLPEQQAGSTISDNFETTKDAPLSFDDSSESTQPIETGEIETGKDASLAYEFSDEQTQISGTAASSAVTSGTASQSAQPLGTSNAPPIPPPPPPAVDTTASQPRPRPSITVPIEQALARTTEKATTAPASGPIFDQFVDLPTGGTSASFTIPQIPPPPTAPQAASTQGRFEALVTKTPDVAAGAGIDAAPNATSGAGSDAIEGLTDDYLRITTLAVGEEDGAFVEP